QHFSELINAALMGDYVTARLRNNHLLDVHPWLYVEGNPVGIKAAMHWAGYCENVLRVPLVKMSDKNKTSLYETLEKVPTLRATFS
ncbi:MAG: dihydrodipicolinate synthase family protein, partial [Bacteroidota bacterium]